MGACLASPSYPKSDIQVERRTVGVCHELRHNGLVLPRTYQNGVTPQLHDPILHRIRRCLGTVDIGRTPKPNARALPPKGHQLLQLQRLPRAPRLNWHPSTVTCSRPLRCASRRRWAGPSSRLADSYRDCLDISHCGDEVNTSVSGGLVPEELWAGKPHAGSNSMSSMAFTSVGARYP